MNDNPNKLAAKRARLVLKSGDRVAVSMCGGRTVTVTMIGWSESFPDFIASRTMSDDELHPINIRKVNGFPVNFGAGGNS